MKRRRRERFCASVSPCSAARRLAVGRVSVAASLLATFLRQGGDPGPDQPPHEPNGQWLGEREPNRALRRLIAPERRGVRLLDGISYRIQAAVVLETSVPYERPSLQPECGDPVTEGLDRTRSGGADSPAKLLQRAPGDGGQRRDVRSDLGRRPSIGPSRQCVALPAPYRGRAQ